jgi:hypothetical protein
MNREVIRAVRTWRYKTDFIPPPDKYRLSSRPCGANGVSEQDHGCTVLLSSIDINGYLSKI